MTIQNTQILMNKIQSLPNDRITEVEDFVDFLKQRVNIRKTITTSKQYSEFPVDDLGVWPEGLSLSRKDMYSDDER